MTKELTIIKVIFTLLLLLVITVKYLLWNKTKKDGASLKSFFYYFFTWHSVYSMYDNQDLQSFMKANNYANLFIWSSLVIIILSFFIKIFLVASS
jgi:hypothetical protein